MTYDGGLPHHSHDAEPEPVDVYRNLHLPGHHWSVRSRRTGRVIGREQKVVVANVSFVVNHGGRDRAQREGVRNVHAFVRGTLRPVEHVGELVAVTYSPFDDAGFVVVSDGTPVFAAPFAVLDSLGCWVPNLHP